MSKFVIKGGKALKGEIQVSGMKNAATPILAATLLTTHDCVIDNIPKIADVLKMLEILKSLGVKVEWTGEHQVTINSQKANLKTLDQQLVMTMRSSILLLGPLLARFKSVKITEPGGCIIGKRPIDTHLSALESLGAKISQKDEYYNLETNGLKATTIILPEFSVTATENAIMAAVLLPGKTIIKTAAQEPSVQELVNFLNNLGTKIKFDKYHTIVIEGVKELKGGKYSIAPDQIEAGTFAILSAASGSQISIQGVVPRHLELFLLKLGQTGTKVEIKEDILRVETPNRLKAVNIQTMPFPGFPTDLQAPFGVLATQCQGTSLIHDPLFEGRMGYVKELIKMGANVTICDPHRVLITGPTKLQGREIDSLDLRAGATLIIAGLIAEGETVINGAEIVDRGYEDIEGRLQRLGAEIKRV